MAKTPTLVINSVMPKGVEHIIERNVFSSMASVINSVMPKGVEHQTGSVDSSSCNIVINSVMPKGVEHTFFLKYWILHTSGD